MAAKQSSQMLKGILSGSILLLLEKEELYGYTLSERLADFGFEQIPMGTIYPLLLSLEKKNLIASESRPSAEGPTRKYYHLTEQGHEEKENFITQWQQLKSSVDALIQNREN